MAPKGRDPKEPKTPPAKAARDAAKKSGLSEEDRALWDLVNRETEPLKRPPARARSAPEPSKDAAPAPARKRPAMRPLPAKARAAAPAKTRPPPLGHGDIADLDKRSAERMRRGRLPIEGTLDLHGHNQDQAQRELAEYLARAQRAGKRCIIVVTGKGDMARGGGVLRNQVPRWLNDPENRARVLAFDYAQPRHGGLGALYVLLRKART